MSDNEERAAIKAHIDKLLAEAPPLSPSQIELLRRIFRSVQAKP